jgi:hypothetical protein
MDMIAIDVNGIINNRERNTIPSETAVNMSILLQTEVSDSHLCRWHQTVAHILVIFLVL